MRSSIGFFKFLLPLLFISHFMASPLPLPSKHLGHTDECNALSEFSNSLTINTEIETRSVCNPKWFNFTSHQTTASWKKGTDCCSWDGISCDNVTGSVVEVRLTCSYLQGTLHSNSTLFLLRDIQVISLGGNNLTGHIPISICQKSSLEVLHLLDNTFFGTIPPCIGNLSNLLDLDLSFNQLGGPLPKSLANCTMLEFLSVGNNEITDTFPLWLKTLPLVSLQLGGNNFHGFIESNPTLFPFPQLEQLLLGPNNFSGQLPSEYFLHSNLRFIDLMGNMFEGDMPIPPPTAEFYRIAGNRFTGQIPSLICNSTSLLVINFSNNSLTGKIPRCLLIPNLEVLDLAMNELQGTLPEMYASNNCSLKTISLSQNHLTGTVPRSLASCERLEVLDLSDNRLSDSFPGWLDSLPTLYVLSLRSNKFQGAINSSLVLHPFPKLHIFDISSNKFRGDFPTRYVINFKDMVAGDNEQGDLYYKAKYVESPHSASVIMKGAEWKLGWIPKSFVSIDLSCNGFEGEIPDGIGNLRSMIGLNFSHNKLTGSIPSSLGNLTELEWLDLSSNYLTGQIPRALLDLTYLAILNLSSNHLSGPIPQGKQFSTFKSDSFSGNPGLCGLPLPSGCEINPKQSVPAPTIQADAEHGSWIEWKAVPMGYGCGLVVGISMGYMALEVGRQTPLAHEDASEQNIQPANKDSEDSSEDSRRSMSRRLAKACTRSLQCAEPMVVIPRS